MANNVELRETIANHPAYPAQTLIKEEIITANFECEGCSLLGHRGRIGYSVQGQLKLHACCAVKPDTWTHHQFGDNEFRFHLVRPAGGEQVNCNVCGGPVLGFVYHYHCPDTHEDVFLHPCCALRQEVTGACPCINGKSSNVYLGRTKDKRGCMSGAS